MKGEVPQIPSDFYESLFENTLDGLAYCEMLFDAQAHPVDFRYIQVNENFEKLTGLKGVAGKKITEVLPGVRTIDPELLKIYAQVSMGGKPERFETYLEPVKEWFLVSVYSPKTQFFVAIFQNITDRKQVEKDLENAKIAARNVLEDLQAEKEMIAHEKAKDDAMLASIGDGVIIVDLLGKITFMNNPGQKLLGWSTEEVLGKRLFDIIHIEDEQSQPISEIARPIARALAVGTDGAEGGNVYAATPIKTGPATYKYTRKDKTKFPVAITVTPVVLGGDVIGAIEVFRDITKEKEIEKAKNEFVSLASHQLRTPISAINWYSEMLLGGDVGTVNEKQKEYLEQIHHGNQRMINLVNTLLSVSRIELGTFEMQPKPTNIADIADDVLDELKTQITEKALQIERNYVKEACVIESDEKSIRIILQNLLANAVDYTPAKGTVSIHIKKTDSGVHIEVGDTGYGIPQNMQSKIYTKFFRADNVNTIKPDGTGLGLYITKSIVQALGGTIDFTSQEGKGTIFSVNVVSATIPTKK